MNKIKGSEFYDFFSGNGLYEVKMEKAENNVPKRPKGVPPNAEYGGDKTYKGKPVNYLWRWKNKSGNWEYVYKEGQERGAIPKEKPKPQPKQYQKPSNVIYLSGKDYLNDLSKSNIYVENPEKLDSLYNSATIEQMGPDILNTISNTTMSNESKIVAMDVKKKYGNIGEFKKNTHKYNKLNSDIIKYGTTFFLNKLGRTYLENGGGYDNIFVNPAKIFRGHIEYLRMVLEQKGYDQDKIEKEVKHITNLVNKSILKIVDDINLMNENLKNNDTDNKKERVFLVNCNPLSDDKNNVVVNCKRVKFIKGQKVDEIPEHFQYTLMNFKNKHAEFSSVSYKNILGNARNKMESIGVLDEKEKRDFDESIDKLTELAKTFEDLKGKEAGKYEKNNKLLIDKASEKDCTFDSAWLKTESLEKLKGCEGKEGKYGKDCLKKLSILDFKRGGKVPMFFYNVLKEKEKMVSKEVMNELKKLLSNKKIGKYLFEAVDGSIMPSKIVASSRKSGKVVSRYFDYDFVGINNKKKSDNEIYVILKDRKTGKKVKAHWKVDIAPSFFSGEKTNSKEGYAYRAFKIENEPFQIGETINNFI